MTVPMRLSYNNYIDNAVITGHSAISSLPLSHLKTDDIQELYRANAASATQGIIADLGAQRTIGVVALINSNLLAPMTYTIRVSAADPTGLDGIPYVSTSDIPAISNPIYNKLVHFIEPQVVGRYVRISQTNCTVATEAGRMVVSDVWAPSHNMQYGYQVPWRDFSTKDRSLGGNEFVDIRPRQRGYRFAIVGLTEEEAQTQVDTLNRLRGIGRDILVCRDKDSADLGRDTVWGLLENTVTQRRIRHPWFEIEVEVWDRV